VYDKIALRTSQSHGLHPVKFVSDSNIDRMLRETHHGFRPRDESFMVAACGPEKVHDETMQSTICTRFIPILLVLAAVGCQDNNQEPPTASAVLPELPEVDLSSFEPVVREQIAAAQEACRADPNSAEACGRLGMLYHVYEWRIPARTYYQRATQLAPEDARWWYYLGRLQSEADDLAVTLDALERSVSIRSDYLPALIQLGRLNLQEGKLDDAERWFTRALTTTPNSHHALLGLGQVCAKREDFAGAIARYQEALEAVPDYREAQYALGQAYRSQGKLELAREHLDKHAEAGRSTPLHDPLMNELASLRRDVGAVLSTANKLMARGRHEEALEHYRQVLENDPTNVQAEYNLGLALERLQRTTEAVDQFRKVIERRPEYVDAHNSLGTSLMDLRQVPEAIDAFRKAVALDPDYAKTQFNLATALAQTRQYDEAIEHYRAGLEHRPENGDGHLQLGTLLLQMGQREEGFTHLRESIRLRPNHGASLLRLAIALQSVGDTDGAIEHYRRCIATRPPSGMPYRNLAGILVERRAFAEAVEVLRQRTDADKNDWRSAMTLAHILATCAEASVREPAEAVRLAEPICRDHAGNEPMALDTLAAAYAAAERFDDAVLTVDKAVKLLAERPLTAHTERITEQLRARRELYLARQPYHAR
jgi:tetratricopeptide (TPR) repeat protein